MNPIFIIGTERSGTNLLRLILNAHPDIAIPHPPHIMKNFFPIEPLYNDLSKDANFKRLVRDVARSVELHPYPWGIRIDTDDIIRHLRRRDLVNVYFAVYDQYLKAAGKKRWGCKSTFMINHVALLLKYRPDAKFIYMVRDGRDVAQSAKKSIFNHYNAYYAAMLWKKEQQTGMYWLRTLSAASIFLLKYEDLVERPEESVKSVCNFLGEMFETKMLRFFETDEAKKSGGLSVSWENTGRPILSENVGKFRGGLRQDEIELFEAIASEELSLFGYALSREFYLSESDRARGVKWRPSYFMEEKALGLKVQMAHILKDKNNLLRFRKFMFIKYAGLRQRILNII